MGESANRKGPWMNRSIGRWNTRIIIGALIMNQVRKIDVYRPVREITLL